MTDVEAILLQRSVTYQQEQHIAALVRQITALGQRVQELEAELDIWRPKISLRALRQAGEVILDLYCGEGGAAAGYGRAGFRCFGVDIAAQPRYPFSCEKADALRFLAALIKEPCDNVIAIHASPVCKGYSVASVAQRKNGAVYPDDIPRLRELLIATGKPYIIENVPGAELRDPVMLCGSHFNRTALVNTRKMGLVQHRLFESNFPIPSPGECDHKYPPITVAGTVAGHGQPQRDRVQVTVEHWREVMDCSWMSRQGLAEAVPPAYAEWVGRALRRHLRAARLPAGTDATRGDVSTSTRW